MRNATAFRIPGEPALPLAGHQQEPHLGDLQAAAAGNLEGTAHKSTDITLEDRQLAVTFPAASPIWSAAELTRWTAASSTRQSCRARPARQQEPNAPAST